MKSVTDQAAGSSEFPSFINCWNRMARGQHHEPITTAEEERIGGDDECAGLNFLEKR